MRFTLGYYIPPCMVLTTYPLEEWIKKKPIAFNTEKENLWLSYQKKDWWDIKHSFGMTPSLDSIVCVIHQRTGGASLADSSFGMTQGPYRHMALRN